MRTGTEVKVDCGLQKNEERGRTDDDFGMDRQVPCKPRLG